jgi:hypothetical protein
VAVVLVALLTIWADSNTPADGRSHIFLNSRARMAVEAAVKHARARLNESPCGEVFSEFVDQKGQRLSERLRLSGQSGADYLSTLYFVEADHRRCRADETIAAFTVPGSRVIHVCAERFAERFALKIADGEFLVIHELLHALGLGENPPTSADITARVRDRCRK